MQSGCFSYSIASCAVNSPTEDAYCVLMSENVSLFAVFDGHGGSFASKYASIHLPGIIVSELTSLAATTPAPNTPATDSQPTVNVNSVAECLHKCFCQCDKEILTVAMKQHALIDPSVSRDGVGASKSARFSSVGSCASLILLVNGVLFSAHCGDCRAVLCRDLSSSLSTGGEHSSREGRSSRRSRLRDSPSPSPSPVKGLKHGSPRRSPALKAADSPCSILRVRAGAGSSSHAGEWFSLCSSTGTSSGTGISSPGKMGDVDQFIPTPKPLLAPLTGLAVTREGDSESGALLPLHHFYRDFHLEAAATGHFRRERGASVGAWGGSDSSPLKVSAGVTDMPASLSPATAICTSTLIAELSTSDSSTSHVLVANKGKSDGRVKSRSSSSGKCEKGADIRSYFRPVSASSSPATITITKALSLPPTATPPDSTKQSVSSTPSVFPLSNSTSTHQPHSLLDGKAGEKAPVHTRSSSGATSPASGCRDVYMRGLCLPTSGVCPHLCANASLPVEERGSSSTTIENKSSHKRKRDSFDCSEGSDQADKATKKSSKVKENMEKFSACKGVFVSEVKKRSKHKHAHKIKSASEFHCVALPFQLEVLALTTDHSLDEPLELAGLQLLSSDPRPFRPSANDFKRFGSYAISRVAGSLSVTRALGDGYLKTLALSDSSSAPHLPYISCFPTVTARAFVGVEVAIVLASDGLWNYIDAYEVAEVIRECIDSHQAMAPAAPLHSHKRRDKHHHDHFDDSPAQRLLAKCQQNAALAAGLPCEVLAALPPGADKRDVMDDVTIIVLFAPPAPLVESSGAL